eukprot:Transcript_12938.p2 GENE.Transcript_12938~~Transcript_12938.p2  ORF type:complete len:163 (+),score=44.46 Transcript_12938:629-1117(+)
MGWPPERPPPPTAAGRVRALGWAVGAHDLRVTAHFAPSSIVYLSPDAPEPLRGAPEKGKVYVVGGLVDRSVRRGASLQRAAELGVATARLPLQEHPGLRSKSRLPLTLNAVVEILIHAQQDGDWAAAAAAALPGRCFRPVTPRRLRPRRSDMTHEPGVASSL